MLTRLTYPDSLDLVRLARRCDFVGIYPLEENPPWDVVDRNPDPEDAMLGMGFRARLHVLVPTPRDRIRRAAVASRVCEADLPRGSFAVVVRQGYGDVIVESPCLVVVRAAADMQARVNAGEMDRAVAVATVAALVCELAGEYACSAGDGDVAYAVSPVLSLDALGRYLSEARGVGGLPLARRACRLAFENSLSPMETCLALALSMPTELGGYGLRRPVLNKPLEFDDRERQLVYHGTMRPDLFWPESRVALEYEGESHRLESSLAEDRHRTSDYMVCGIKVYHVTYGDVCTTSELDRVALRLIDGMGLRARDADNARSRVWVADPGLLALRGRVLSALLPQGKRES